MIRKKNHVGHLDVIHFRTLGIELELALQLRLTGRIFSNVNSFDVFFHDIPPPHESLVRCKLVPVHYREYEYGLFNKLASDFHASVLLLTTHIVITLSK